MATVKVHNLEGKAIGNLKLPDSVFSVPANNALIHQVYVILGANRRQSSAHTMNRGERAGSGKKPWRQKGTGRARAGSVRSPLWKKGGVAFGPTSDKNYTKKINKKMNARALAMVLSGKLRDNELLVVDKIIPKEKKTKAMAAAIKNLKIKGRTLIGFSESEKGYRLFSRNLDSISNILTRQLNVLDILNHKNILISKESVKYLEEKYAKAGTKE